MFNGSDSTCSQEELLPSTPQIDDVDTIGTPLEHVLLHLQAQEHPISTEPPDDFRED